MSTVGAVLTALAIVGALYLGCVIAESLATYVRAIMRGEV